MLEYLKTSMKKTKLLIFVGLALLTGFVWGQIFAPDNIHRDILQHYSNPEIPIGQYDQMVSVDIIRKGDDIWVVEHFSGQLIFEYNRLKEADKEAFGEYEDLLIEALTQK